jgi:hypothetical protein
LINVHEFQQTAIQWTPVSRVVGVGHSLHSGWEFVNRVG